MTIVDSRQDTLDKKLLSWRQGDCTITPQSFIYAFDLNFRVTEATKNLEGSEPGEVVAEEVDGLVILTQTCDIVRSVKDRPFVEVAPLIKRDEDEILKISKGMYPRFAIVPGIQDKGLVADLDRTMTIEKPLVEKWEKINGCRTDEESRKFANALARKRARSALPDDFIEHIKSFRNRCIKKHGKDSAEGRALAAIAEIRVQPEPNWDSEPTKIRFWFLLSPTIDIQKKQEIDAEVNSLMDHIQSNDKFIVDYVIAFHKDMSAADYIVSDLLDLDHLSN